MILTEKDIEVLKYCLPHIKYMWASRVIGIILGCEFRNSETELQKLVKAGIV